MRLLDFCNKNSNSSAQQFGFTKNKSTLDAFIKLTDSIYDALNPKKFSMSVFIDYRKAFDTINHEILLRKLEHYGIRGLALELMKSYLKNRQQAVKNHQMISSSRPILCGVPQGTIMGPLLFLIYINDVTSLSKLYEAILFADDTTLSFQNQHLLNLTNMVNAELIEFAEWSFSNRLSMNVEKNNYMMFTTRPVPDVPSPIILNGCHLIPADDVIFLGVTIDSNLSFKIHISNVCSKVAKSIGVMHKMKEYLPRHCLEMLYYSLIYPYILYCVTVWGGTFQIHLNPLILLQERAIRIMNNASFLDHTTPLFYKSGTLKVVDVYNYSLALHMFKNNRPVLFQRTHSQSTRCRSDLIPPFQRLTTTQHSVDFNGCKLWNELSDDR